MKLFCERGSKGFRGSRSLRSSITYVKGLHGPEVNNLLNPLNLFNLLNFFFLVYFYKLRSPDKFLVVLKPDFGTYLHSPTFPTNTFSWKVHSFEFRCSKNETLIAHTDSPA
jgi:hypothetical protein